MTRTELRAGKRKKAKGEDGHLTIEIKGVGPRSKSWHCEEHIFLPRQAKRKAAFLRKSKHNQVKDEVDQQNVDTKTIQATKSVLIFDAKDSIQHFQNVHINQFENVFSDGEDDDGFAYGVSDVFCFLY
ncbi:unnamed protein product [Cuscuta epithymum]|uniref:Uncharacterized protein n=1 Tax=Cuscuta epithymum TaxID=186058 RepID=A0AAV0CW48_9ASTE|nr:unnamed protein product [Cuscuta epithymum]